MTTRAPQPEPGIFYGNSVIVIGSVLLVITLTIAVSFLYESKLAPSRLERVWLDSQRIMPATANDPLDDRSVVTLVRTRCYGACPTYQVSVFGTGRVEFVGEAFVCEKHPAPVQIDAVALRQLIAGLDAIRFTEIPDYVRPDVTDNASATVVVKRPNAIHTVRHYHGDTSAPRLLTWIESRIDEIAGSAAWIGNTTRCSGKVEVHTAIR
jgi:Domain of unknown function (DUF6438)